MRFSWLTTLNLDRGNDRSFDICYHSFPMSTCLKQFINTYRYVCWMKSTPIDGLDVPYIRPWKECDILELHGMIRMWHAIACPTVFILLSNRGWWGGELKFMKNDYSKYFFAVISCRIVFCLWFCPARRSALVYW